MSHPTFIGQPPFRLPNAEHKTPSVTLPILSVQTLSIAPFPVYHTTTTPRTNPSLIHFQTATPFSAPPPAPAASKTTIIWFRSDLRLHDHTAFTHAIEHAATASLLPLFIFDPRRYGKTPFGFEKTGRYRAKFLLQSLENLRQSLRKLGSDLVIRTGHPEQIIPEIAKSVSASTVFCHTEISRHDTNLDSLLEKSLKRAGVNFCPLWSNTLYHLYDLPFPIENLPEIYSTYREQVQTKSKVRPPLPVPDSIPRLPSVDPGETPSLSQLGLTDPPPNPAASQNLVGGETEALKMLSAFVAHASKRSIGYSSSEHHTADFSCRIAPWLQYGCISPRKMYADLVKNAPRAKQVGLYFDLVWRDFFRYLSVKYSRENVRNMRQGVPLQVQ